MNSDEFAQEEERTQECEKMKKRRKRKKKYVLVISHKRTIRRGRCGTRGRKKGAAIYKSRYHRNWASLRQTEEHDTWEVDLKRGFSKKKKKNLF